MKHVLFLIAVISICLFLGCSRSQGLHMESIQETLRQESAKFSGDRPENSPATSPARRIPSKLGLYAKPTGFLKREFEWTGEDRDTLLFWAKNLQKSGVVTDAMFVPQSSLKGNTLAELRTSAARYGMDLILVIDGAVAVDRYNNYKAALLYWTILGAYLADGTHSDALCVIHGTLWDVKSGSRLFQEESEGRAQTVGPAAFVDDDAMVLKARRQALDRLLDSLANWLVH
ncbi:MAG TPA: hypothetical protein VIU63_09700 [Nitrospira sp.]